MARALRQTDVSDTPELRRLAEEVQRTQEPRLLVNQAQELALVVPVRGAPRPRSAPAPTRPRYPSVAELRGTAGTLSEPRSWNDLERIAAEDHAREAAREGL